MVVTYALAFVIVCTLVILISIEVSLKDIANSLNPYSHKIHYELQMNRINTDRIATELEKVNSINKGREEE